MPYTARAFDVAATERPVWNGELQITAPIEVQGDSPGAQGRHVFRG